MTVEVGAGPFRHRPADAPAGGEKVGAVPSGHHGIGMLGDKRDEDAVGTLAEQCPGQVRGL